MPFLAELLGLYRIFKIIHQMYISLNSKLISLSAISSSIEIIGSEKNRLLDAFLRFDSCFCFLKLGFELLVLLHNLGDLLIHDGVVAGLQYGQIVDSLLQSNYLLFQLLLDFSLFCYLFF